MYYIMKKVDVLQVFISSSAIVGIGIIWINFNVKVFQTVWDLMKAPFSEARRPREETD